MLVNCAHCGRLIKGAPNGLCPDCQRLDDQELLRVRAYLHRQPNQSAGDLSRNTGMPIERILRWLREGRLLAARPKRSGAPGEPQPDAPSQADSSPPKQKASFHIADMLRDRR